MNTPAVRKLNEQFREEFMQQLPALVADIGTLVAGLRTGKKLAATLSAIFLQIHSIRGASSTFGAQLIAAVCHPYEELLDQCTQTGEASAETLELIESYHALLARTVEEVRAGRESFEATEAALRALHQRSFKSPFSFAIATSSRSLMRVCQEVGAALGARVVTFEDSLNALQRSLAEPFDVLLASSELYPMRGEALISALNMSRRHGHPLTTILVSGDAQKAHYTLRQYDPDYVLLRDASLVEKLQETLNHILETRGIKTP